MGLFRKTIKLKHKYIAALSYLYFIIPIILFYWGWVRLYYSIPLSAFLLLGFSFLYRDQLKDNEDMINLPILAFIIPIVIIMIWALLSGQCGLFVQTYDWHGRNAVLRDLINYSWPVYYPKTGNALNFYFVFWLVPALVGKVLGWKAAYLALFIWVSLGVSLSFLLICFCIKAEKLRDTILVIVIFIIWGGVNIFGMLLAYSANVVETLNVIGGDLWLRDQWFGEPYRYNYEYSSNNTLLQWVFHQSVTTWVATPLFLSNKSIRNYIFLGLCLFAFCPIPFIGLMLMMICSGFEQLIESIKNKNIAKIFKDVISKQNIMALLAIVLPFFLFYSSNPAVSEKSIGGGIKFYYPIEAFTIKRIILLLIFYLISYGVYMLAIKKDHKKDKFFYVVGIILMIIPLLQVGKGRDFCMRGCIAPLFVVMIWVIQYIIKRTREKKIDASIVTLIILLSFSSFNFTATLFKWTRAYINNGGPIVCDDLETYGNNNPEDESDITDFINCLIKEPENTKFYKYIGKELK